MVDVQKYCFAMWLTKKSIRYEHACKIPTKKMTLGTKFMKKNMRYELVCKSPINNMARVHQNSQSYIVICSTST